jgi:hypothetical protein
MNLEIPNDGVLISGIWLECARWDLEKKCIIEMKPKQLYSRVPVIWMCPSAETNLGKKKKSLPKNES